MFCRGPCLSRSWLSNICWVVYWKRSLILCLLDLYWRGGLTSLTSASDLILICNILTTWRGFRWETLFSWNKTLIWIQFKFLQELMDITIRGIVF
tara:strand:+ start:5107 stop:5391 length:285 start_codon:yes stop_codon:yes gene_type:complete